MRIFSKNGTISHGMNRTSQKNHPGRRIQKRGYGTLEKVLLAIIAACLFIVLALSI